MWYQRQNEIICFSFENISVISLFPTINSLIIRITYLGIAKKCPETIKILPCTKNIHEKYPKMHITNNKSSYLKEALRSTALFTICLCIWLNRLINKKVSEWINAWKQHVIAADRGATLGSHWFCCLLFSLNMVNRFEKVQFTVINWRLIPL